ncbi:pleckstrin homology domain-containing family G member 3-like [Enoplosus armatus]|uniref:pleckstrin homology domain-containing family G member 3-like n=1 Tax=Enoplosus armatus TaxID=215367 RepID=UPI00399104AA
MEDYLPSGCLPFVILKNWKSSLVICQLRWHLPTSLARGLSAMPEGSHSALHQGQMGEESTQLSSPLSTSEHDQANVDVGPDCYSRLCVEPLDGEGERPVSLVSTLSSGSSRDSRSLSGSTVALPSSTTPPVQSEEDIDLDLSPAEGTGERAGDQSPTLTGTSGRWQERLEPRVISNQWNNNNATSNRKTSGEILHISASPVVTNAMVPNPKLTYVDRVVMEIIETERMYVKDLRSIVEDYLAHIIDMNNLPIRPEQVCALFGNIEDIYEFNSELLQSLDMCENDPVAIARCFVDKSEYFEIYTQYCTNYPNSVAALTDCMRSKTLAKFFRDRQAALKRSLPLGSYLLKPVQRILKYHLLLQEIAKHFDPDEEGYEVIQEAIDTMTGVAWYINDMKRKHEHAVRVQEIQSLLINWKGPDLTTYGELVLEGTFHVLRAKNTRTLFLFEKMLLITKKRGEHYVYKIHISCSTLMLLDSAKDPLLFSVIHFKHPKQPHTVQAKSVEEKRLWAHHIKRLILENHNTIVPQKVKETILDNSNYPGKYHYSPERLKKESYQADDFHHGGRNGRRRSEPAKQIIRSTKAVLKHADSEGALLGERCSLQPATSVSTLASSLGEPQAARPCVEDLIPRRDSLEQLSPTDSDPKLGSSPSEGRLELEKAEEAKEEEEEEGESYEEDILMGDDQVADFASSVLAAISCWHYRARALLSTHFTTDDQNRDTAELKTSQMEEVETCRREEKHVDVKENLTTQELCPLGHIPQAKTSHQLEVHYSQYLESAASPLQREADTPEPQDTSRETGEEEEGESDSSGLQAEETSVLTNGELSEEEEEALSDNKSILPSSVLDQASVIAERFISSLSRRSSLVSEELGSLACPSPSIDNDVFKSPSACMDLEKQTQMLASSSPQPQVTSEANLSTPANVPALNALIEGERRSTLSKQDRLLIHKIRRYYEHAEHQDANFSIKRRESLSYIPAGLVRHLSRQLNDVPQEQAAPVHRKGLSRNRPTSWSVFDLPGLEKSRNTLTHPKAETQRPVEAKARSQSVTDASTTDEEFRPSSDMLKVWEDMELEEESQEVQQIAEEKLHDSRLEAAQDFSLDTSDVRTSKKPPLILEESDISTASDGSSISSPTPTFPAVEGGSCQDSKTCGTPISQENGRVNHGQLPKIISFRASMDEDQILQDMGKVKNKVFQLARQYSQRIKNNRPILWPRNREPASQQSFKNMPAVHEEKMQLRKKGKPNLRLPLNTCDQAVIHEECSPSPVQTPSSGGSSQSTVTCPQSPQPDTFHWPDVQELRTKYTETSSKVTRSCTVPSGMLECCTNRCNGCSHKYNSSSDLHQTRGEEDWPQPQPQLQPLLCRWSSLDHMLGSLPLHEVQNLQESVRTCYTASQVSLLTRETGKLQDRDNLLQEGSDFATKSSALSSGKMTESNLVKSLREKFQSLSTSS